MRTRHVTLFAFTLLSTARAVTVYLYPPPAAPVPPQLDAPHASFALARHLGLERFEKLGDGDGIWDGALVVEQEGLVGSAPRDGLLVSMSEEDAQAILPSNLKPTFELPSPTMDSLHPLIQTYIHRAADLYSNVYSTLSTSFSNQWTPLLDIFSAPTEANRVFLESASALADYLDVKTAMAGGSGYDNFGAFELNGLKELAQQYGKDSEAYQTALNTLKAVFLTAMERSDSKLAVVTFSAPSASSKRADAPQSPFAPAAPQPAEPVSDISNCFTSAQACGNATDSCSGHGECVAATKLGRTCYVCACSASVDEKGRRDEWAGSACERKDISGPFVLLGGTVIALILLVAGSVALLSGIGSQELPSTLTGAVSAGHKRD